MNIHFLAATPEETARDIDNARLTALNKEALQLINNAFCAFGAPSFWSPTHQHHPCSIWACESWQNVAYLVRYATVLLAERHSAGYNSDETSRILPIVYQTFDNHAPLLLPAGTNPPNCARSLDLGLDYSSISGHVTAYRYYMTQRWLLDAKKGRKPRWRNAHVPEWLAETNPEFHEFLVTHRSDPLPASRTSHPYLPPRMFYCAWLKNSPITPPKTQSAPTPVRRLGPAIKSAQHL